MNLLGKLFIFLIFIGSIMLASFSVVLYSTHTNWRELVDGKQGQPGLRQRLQDKEKELADLQKQRDSMETALRLEINNRASQIVALTERIGLLTQENENLRTKNTELADDLVRQVAAVEAATEELRVIRGRLDEQSKALLTAQNEWVSMSTELAKKMDEAHGLAIQLTSFRETASKLAHDYRNAVEVLRLHGLQPDPALYPERPPTGVRGFVTEVRPMGNVEISIGTDSGLAKGHQLDVVRVRDGRTNLIGKIEVIAPVADRASAKVMPQFRTGTVQVGDEVMYIEVNELVAH